MAPCIVIAEIFFSIVVGMGEEINKPHPLQALPSKGNNNCACRQKFYVDNPASLYCKDNRLIS
jgi:hypothetical protein